MSSPRPVWGLLAVACVASGFAFAPNTRIAPVPVGHIRQIDPYSGALHSGGRTAAVRVPKAVPNQSHRVFGSDKRRCALKMISLPGSADVFGPGQVCWSLRCCAVPCRAVPCRVLRGVVVCLTACTMACHAARCCTVLRHAVLSHPCGAVRCCSAPC